MKYLSVLATVLILAACHQNSVEQKSEKVQVASAVTASAADGVRPTAAYSASVPNGIESLAKSAQLVSGSVKDQYLDSCVSSALQNHLRDEKSVKTATAICQCAYDSGVKAYGNVAQFDAAVKNSFEHPDKIDEKLLKISDETIQACMKQQAQQK